jgi:hypothetical protein
MISAVTPLAVFEMTDGMFNGYVGALTVSGVLLVLLGAIGFRQTVGMRIVDVLFGLGFLGYAFYLFFLFDGGDIAVFYYAFIAPIALIIKAFRGRTSAAN